MDHAFGQSYQFIHFDKDNSFLSYNGIKCLLEDSRGFIWIGTNYGLNRYDGTRITEFHRDILNTNSDYISALIEDKEGKIFIGTDDGLVCYDYSMDSFTPVPDSPSERIYTLFNCCGTIYAGAKDMGLYKYSETNRNLKHLELKTEDGIPLTSIYRAAADSAGRIWIATYYDNLFHIEPGDSIARSLDANANPFFHDDIEGIVTSKADHNIIYIASKANGLCEYNVESAMIQRRVELPSGSRPTGLYCFNKTLWVTTSNGVVYTDMEDFQGRTIHNIPQHNLSLNENHTFGLAFSHNANGESQLVIGTANSGINLWSSYHDVFRKYTSLSTGEMISGCMTRSLTEDSEGTLWIGTENKGLLYVGADNRLLKYNKASQLPKSINAIFAEGTRLWIGSNNGVFLLDTGTGILKEYKLPESHEVLSDSRVLSFFKSKNGTFYVGTSVGALYFEAKNDRFMEMPLLGTSAIENFAEEPDGTIWVASYHDGVYRYNPDRNEVIKHYCTKIDGSPIPEMTSSIHIDKDSNIWILSFSSGFFRYDTQTNSFDIFNKSTYPELPTEIFLNALTDNNGNLWLSSDSGLVLFDVYKKTFRVFSSRDGLPNDGFTKAAIEMSNGTLAMGSADGVAVFSPEDITSINDTSSVTITEFEIGQDIITPSSKKTVLTSNIDISPEICLNHNQNSFGFKFACPKATLQGNKSILCKLEGWDKEWRDVSISREIYYYNIPKGNYILKVTGHKDLNIKIKPRFIETAGGIATLVLSILAISAVIFTIILGKIKKREVNKRKEHERKASERLLLEKLNFFANLSEEIKTPITLIYDSINCLKRNISDEEFSDDINILSAGAEHLSGLASELSEYIKAEENDSVLSLRDINIVERIKFLCSSIDAAAEGKSIKLKNSQKEIEFPTDSKTFDKIFLNLLQYTAKHTASKVVVNIEDDEDALTIEIQGDGGNLSEDTKRQLFTPFAILSDERAIFSQKYGIGLSLAKTLAENLGGMVRLTDMDSVGFILQLPRETATVNEPDTIENVEIKQNCPLILLVEENKGIQSYISKKIRDNYGIIAVPDGETALTVLKTYSPDLVIIDSSLPGMSGMELCQKISSNQTAGSLPSIILSSISNNEINLRYLEYGASLVIEKPFTTDYLMGSIQTILEQKNRIRQVYAKRMPQTPWILENLTNRDEQFIAKLEELLQARIADSSFCAAEIEQMANMSRSTLSRKIKQLYGTSPADYIRDKRLELAAEIISSNKIRISEVCYKVGFNSPSYFAKCFKRKYGILPLEYAQNAMKESGDL